MGYTGFCGGYIGVYTGLYRGLNGLYSNNGKENGTWVLARA